MILLSLEKRHWIAVKPNEGAYQSWRWILLAGAQGLRIQALAAIGSWEEENRRLKKMVAEERLKAEMVQETLQKKW